MGFGFGEENLDLIIPEENAPRAKKIYASIFDINARRWLSLERLVLQRLARTSDNNGQSLLSQLYQPGRIQTVKGCGELVDHFSLEWIQ